MMNGWMFGMGWGWLVLILFLIVVVVGVMMASRGGWSSRSGTGTPPPRTDPPRTDTRQAEEILKERYARGEITREEYEQMRHNLEA
jgi:putative membrane protein